MSKVYVLVNFRVEDGKKTKARPVVQEVEKEYIGGSVGTVGGEVYKVEPLPAGSVAEVKGRRIPVHFLAVS